MTKTLEKAIDQARRYSAKDQEVLGLVLEAATAGRNLTLEQAEEEYMIQSSLRGLAEAERGEGYSEAEARQRMEAFLSQKRST